MGKEQMRGEHLENVNYHFKEKLEDSRFRELYEAERRKLAERGRKPMRRIDKILHEFALQYRVESRETRNEDITFTKFSLLKVMLGELDKGGFPLTGNTANVLSEVKKRLTALMGGERKAVEFALKKINGSIYRSVSKRRNKGEDDV